MTEAGEKWAETKAWNCDCGETGIKMIDFWLRAFCDEVEMRAYLSPSTSWQKSMIQSFDEAKRELLGEK